MLINAETMPVDIAVIEPYGNRGSDIKYFNVIKTEKKNTNFSVSDFVGKTFGVKLILEEVRNIVSPQECIENPCTMRHPPKAIIVMTKIGTFYSGKLFKNGKVKDVFSGTWDRVVLKFIYEYFSEITDFSPLDMVEVKNSWLEFYRKNIPVFVDAHFGHRLIEECSIRENIVPISMLEPETQILLSILEDEPNFQYFKVQPAVGHNSCCLIPFGYKNIDEMHFLDYTQAYWNITNIISDYQIAAEKENKENG